MNWLLVSKGSIEIDASCLKKRKDVLARYAFLVLKGRINAQEKMDIKLQCKICLKNVSALQMKSHSPLCLNLKVLKNPMQNILNNFSELKQEAERLEREIQLKTRIKA